MGSENLQEQEYGIAAPLEDRVLKTAAQFFGEDMLPRVGIGGRIERVILRACLKIHSRHLHAPLCGIFDPNSLNVARYAALIWAKSPTNCGAQLAESNFQTRSTEHIHLEMRKMEEDFNFLMKDGSLRHLEFESDSITEQDLRRFREYEAYLGMVYNVPVITTVLCTSNVKILKRELVNGNSVYRVEVVRLKDKDAQKGKLTRRFSLEEKDALSYYEKYGAEHKE